MSSNATPCVEMRAQRRNREHADTTKDPAADDDADEAQIVAEKSIAEIEAERLRQARDEGNYIDLTWDKDTCVSAAKGGNLEVLQWTRANGCPWKPPRNEKAMIIAAQEGQETVVRALLEAGADVNKTLDKGATPLYIAAQNSHEAVVRALIELGADVNKAKDNGVTPLFIAAQNGHEAVVRALIELGADVNKAMDNGGTPLNVAAQNGHAAIVRALIDLGADFKNATDNGGTPLDAAVEKGHDAIVQILRDAGAA